MISKFIFSGLASVATFLVPASTWQGTFTPTPEDAQVVDQGCEVTRETTTWQTPEGTTWQETTTWQGCSS